MKSLEKSEKLIWEKFNELYPNKKVQDIQDLDNVVSRISNALEIKYPSKYIIDVLNGKNHYRITESHLEVIFQIIGSETIKVTSEQVDIIANRIGMSRSHTQIILKRLGFDYEVNKKTRQDYLDAIFEIIGHETKEVTSEQVDIIANRMKNDRSTTYAMLLRLGYHSKANRKTEQEYLLAFRKVAEREGNEAYYAIEGDNIIIYNWIIINQIAEELKIKLETVYSELRRHGFVYRMEKKPTKKKKYTKSDKIILGEFNRLYPNLTIEQIKQSKDNDIEKVANEVADEVHKSQGRKYPRKYIIDILKGKTHANSTETLLDATFRVINPNTTDLNYHQVTTIAILLGETYTSTKIRLDKLGFKCHRKPRRSGYKCRKRRKGVNQQKTEITIEGAIVDFETKQQMIKEYTSALPISFIKKRRPTKSYYLEELIEPNTILRKLRVESYNNPYKIRLMWGDEIDKISQSLELYRINIISNGIKTIMPKVGQLKKEDHQADTDEFRLLISKTQDEINQIQQRYSPQVSVFSTGPDSTTVLKNEMQNISANILEKLEITLPNLGAASTITTMTVDEFSNAMNRIDFSKVESSKLTNPEKKEIIENSIRYLMYFNAIPSQYQNLEIGYIDIACELLYAMKKLLNKETKNKIISHVESLSQRTGYKTDIRARLDDYGPEM